MTAKSEFAKAVLVQLAVLALMFATSPRPAKADPVLANATLNQSFVAVRSCLPFTVLIQPPVAGNSTVNSTNANGTVTVNADQSVVDSLWVTLDQGVLALSLWDGFLTNHVINVTVTPGATDSLEVVENLGTGDIVIGKGLNSSSLSLSTYSLGSIYAYGVNTSRLAAATSGISTVSVTGNVSRADITALGTSHVYLNASNSSIMTTVRTEGISSVVVAGGRGTRITGAADGLSKVLFTSGICDVNSDSPFGVLGFTEPCRQIWGPARGERPAPTFACGLRVSGDSVCGGPDNTTIALNTTNATNITNATAPTGLPNATAAPGVTGIPSTVAVPPRRRNVTVPTVPPTVPTTPNVTTPPTTPPTIVPTVPNATTPSTTPPATVTAPGNVTSPPTVTNVTAPAGTPGGSTAGNPTLPATPPAVSPTLPTTPTVPVVIPTPAVGVPPPPAATPGGTPGVVTPAPPTVVQPRVSPSVTVSTAAGRRGRRISEDHHHVYRRDHGHHRRDATGDNADDIAVGPVGGGVGVVPLIGGPGQGLAVASAECRDPAPEPLVSDD